LQTGIFNIKQRRIFQFIETDAAHFTETKVGAAMICPKSLTVFLDEKQEKLRK